VGVVLPADMEAGKTTLTCGLVRAGFEYLSDEAAVFDWDTGELRAYPKPLSIDPGAWPLFPDLEPHAGFTDDAYKRQQWQVAPEAVRPGAARPVTAPRCAVSAVVFPRYEAGAATRLEPLRRAEGLWDLVQQTFRFDELGRRALEPLAEVVRGAECYRLTMGELDRAVELVSELVPTG
jgi:hypothetical protein